MYAKGWECWRAYPAPTGRFVTTPSATSNAKSEEHHCFAVCSVLQDFEERETQKDSDNHCRARETESIRLELKLLESNWSVGKKEQREDVDTFNRELVNRLQVFMQAESVWKGGAESWKKTASITNLFHLEKCVYVYIHTDVHTH